MRSRRVLPSSQISRLNLCLAVSILGMLLAADGCGKKESAQTQTQAGQASAVPQVNQPVTTLGQTNGGVDLPELQRSVIRWVVANHRRPNSFEDFATTAGVQIPPPPAGKKYIITHDLHVLLVSQ